MAPSIRAAARLIGLPMAAVSIVREDRLTIHAAHGLDLDGVPRTGSFCEQAIQDPSRVLVVPDAEDDDRFGQNPLVEDHDVRFYAGAPILVGEDQTPLGTLCVLDEAPRSLQRHHLQGLEALAEQASKLLEQESTPRPPVLPDPGPLPIQEPVLRGPLLRLGRTLNVLEDRHRGDEGSEDFLASAWEQMRILHRALDALKILVEPEDPEPRIHMDAIVDELADALEDHAPRTTVLASELPRPAGSPRALRTLISILIEAATEPDVSAPRVVTVDGDKTAPGWRFTIEATPREGTRETSRDARIERSLRKALAASHEPLDTRLVLCRLIAHAHGGTLELLDAGPRRIRFLFTLDPRPRPRHRWDPP